jgi:hypothetical protein
VSQVNLNRPMAREERKMKNEEKLSKALDHNP